MRSTLIWKIFLGMLLLGTLISLIIDVKISYDGYKKKREIYELSREEMKDENDVYIQNVDETWRKFCCVRVISGAVVIMIYGIAVGMALHIGPERRLDNHITRDEVARYIKQIEIEYEKNGQTVKEDFDETDAVLDGFSGKLKTPKILTAVYKNRCVMVSWVPVPFAQGYSVWKRINDGNWEKVGNTVATEPIYADYSLDADIIYNYSVKAILNLDGKMIQSGMDKLGVEVYVPQGNRLPAPNISVDSSDDGIAKIVWDSIETAHAYCVYRRSLKKIEGKDDKWQKIATIKKNSTLEYIEMEQLSNSYEYTVATVSRINGVNVVGVRAEKGVII